MRVSFLCLTAAIFISACHGTTTYTTEVTSNSPGVRIEVNNDYLGTTPTTITWSGFSENGRFVDQWDVKAIPVTVGQFVQEKHFRGTLPGHSWGDPIPKHIFFDMSISNSAKQFNIDSDVKTDSEK